MPKCSRCPIKRECNENPILVPRKQGKEDVMVRLCPLLIAIGHAMKPPEPPKISAAK